MAMVFFTFILGKLFAAQYYRFTNPDKILKNIKKKEGSKINST